MTLVKIGKTGDIKENSGKEVKIGETRVAIFHANGKWTMRSKLYVVTRMVHLLPEK